MKHILILLVSLVLAASAAVSNVSTAEEFGDPDWVDYGTLKAHVRWAAKVVVSKDVALAAADNGAWGRCWGASELDAKDCAKETCETYSEGRSCLIVDVNIKRLEYSLRKLYEKHGGVDRGNTVWCAYPRLFSGMGYGSVSRGLCKMRSGVVTASANTAQLEHRRLKNQSSTVATTSNSSKKVWCATKYRAFETTKAHCKSRKLKSFPTKYQAQVEHRRLKSQSSTAATTTEVTESQTAAVDQSALDLEFWQSIKDSNDPDMFKAYLRNYPTGAFIDLAKIKIKKLTGSTTSVTHASIPNLDYGNYHALVVGNNRYQNYKDLNTPINDARTVSRILRESYGFTVDVLENATESEMFKAIVELRSNVGRNDNVLIYFGGHGELDRDTEEGFWIPSDARRDDPSTYIPVDRIRKQIKAMSAKHVMVVADSCFSGSLTRSTLTRALKVKPRSPEYQSELQRIIDKKSRTALTSGGLEPVLDSGGDGHSVFASAFISALRDNSGVLDAHELFIQVRKKVRNNSPQDPEYTPIYETGHDHGDFLFVRR